MRDPRESFGPVAESYVTSAVHGNPAALAHLVEIVQPSGGLVVDVATGGGHAAYALAPFVDLMVATDITPDMLWVTKAEAAKRGLQNVEVCFAEAHALPFGRASVDGLCCRVAAHHFTSAESFTREAARVLKPQGWFLLVDTVGIQEPDADDQLDKFERLRDPSHVRNHTIAWWHAEVAGNGMEIVRCESSKKEIEVEEWMARMRVPASDREVLRATIHQSTGRFREYLEPMTRPSGVVIHLEEMRMLARRLA